MKFPAMYLSSQKTGLSACFYNYFSDHLNSNQLAAGGTINAKNHYP